MSDGVDVLTKVCSTLDGDRPQEAATILREEYPFAPLINAGRRYSADQSMRMFVRDGFIDRYSGKRLVFPGTLRLLSQLFPAEFPFHNNWKTDACHFAFYELFPTIDHVVPVSRGGADQDDNWVSTSMVRNAAKANFTVEELGWGVVPPGAIAEWDGLTGWFMARLARDRGVASSPYLHRWATAAMRALPTP